MGRRPNVETALTGFAIAIDGAYTRWASV